MKGIDLLKVVVLAFFSALGASSIHASTIAGVTPIPSPQISALGPVTFLVDGGELAGITGLPVLTPGGPGFLVAPTAIPTSGFAIGQGAATYLGATYLESALSGNILTVLFSNDGGTGSGGFASYLLMTLTGANPLPVDGTVGGASMTLTGASVNNIPLPLSGLALASALGCVLIGARSRRV